MIAPLALLVLAALRPTSLVFIRHAETLANKTGHYNARTLNSFSPLGASKIAAATGQLEAMGRFDKILVSPSPRVLMTIAPYLRDTHQKALVWPLLYECCTDRRPAGAHATKFKWGAKISIPAALTGLFVIDPAHDRLPVSPDYDAGLAQVAACVEEFKRLYSGGHVLLAGHSGEGGHLLHELTGRWIKVENAKPISVEVH